MKTLEQIVEEINPSPLGDNRMPITIEISCYDSIGRFIDDGMIWLVTLGTNEARGKTVREAMELLLEIIK